MSLVEAIIAITILSVAVAPLLYTFVYSTKYNAKAKVKQRATNAAMSVMESFKAYELEDAKKHFDDGDFIVGNESSKGVVYDAPDDATNGTYKISNMAFSDGTETKRYNVEITVSDGNSAYIDNTPLYNTSKDVLFEEDPTVTKNYDPYEVVNSLIGPGTGVNGEDVSEVKIHRNIYISIDSLGSVIVEYVFDGNFVMNGSTYPIHFSSDNDPKLKTELNITPELDDDGNPISSSLRDIFFYYFPAYAGKGKPISGEDYLVKIEKDRIYLSNNYTNANNIDGSTNIYIFKQRNNVRFADNIKLLNAETNYSVDLYVTNGVNKKINLYDVINANLGDLSITKNIFGDKKSDGASATQLDLVETILGMESMETIPLTSYITVSVSDPADASGDTLSVLKSTILR